MTELTLEEHEARAMLLGLKYAKQVNAYYGDPRVNGLGSPTTWYDGITLEVVPYGDIIKRNMGNFK